VAEPPVDATAQTRIGQALEFRPRGAVVPPPKRSPMIFVAAAALLGAVGLVGFVLSRSPRAPVADAGPAAAAPMAAAVAPVPPLPVGDARLLLETDADCSLALDGINRGVLKLQATQRFGLAAGNYTVSCTSLAHPDVTVSQGVAVALDEPSVVLFELKAKTDTIDRLRTAEQARLAEEARQKADAVRIAEEREAAEAQRRIGDARQAEADRVAKAGRIEADRLAAETSKLEQARAAAQARRELETRKLEEARAAAAARAAGIAAPARPAAAPPASSPVDAEAARLAEQRRRAAQETARKQREARLAEKKMIEAAEAARIVNEQAAAQAAAAAAVVPKRLTPIAVSTPQPDYPPVALRSGITGTVEVQITVRRDGSVANVRVLSAKPRGTFERSVLASLRTWRFQPLDAEVTIIRTINFR